MSLHAARLLAARQQRLTPLSSENTRGVTGRCLDPAALLISKYAAHRPKDLSFCKAVVLRGLVDSQVAAERILTAPGTSEEHQWALEHLQCDVGRDKP